MKSRLSSLSAVCLMALTAVYTFIVAISPIEAATITVNPGESIQTAIDNATAGDTILISAGTYTESITLNKAVSLTGVSSDTTILNGPINQRVISVALGVDSSVVISGMTIQNGGRGISPTQGGGLYLAGIPRLHNLTIQHNTAISGAGIYSAKDIVITSSTVQKNEQGSGIVSQQNITLIQSQVISNTASGHGGGVYSGRSITASNSLISGNQALLNPATISLGGGLYASETLYLFNSELNQNYAYDEGGGAYAKHAYIYTSTIAQNSAGLLASGLQADLVVVSNSTFSGNHSSPIVGALAAYTATVSNSSFIGNDANFYASAIAADVLTLTNSIFQENNFNTLHSSEVTVSVVGLVSGLVSNTLFISNTGTIASAILYYDYAYPEIDQPLVQIINSRFVANKSDGSGAAIHVYDGNNMGNGHLHIKNTVFHDNQSSSGARSLFLGDEKTAVLEHVSMGATTPYVDSAVYLSGTAELTLTNSIVASYTTAVETHNGATANIDYSLFTSATPFSGTNITVGSNIITNTNPLFLDSLAHDYRLLAGSPAINAGIASSVTTDIDRNTRPGPRSSVPDMGAYECDTITAESVTASDTAFWYTSQNRESLDTTISLSHCDPENVLIIPDYNIYLPLVIR